MGVPIYFENNNIEKLRKEHKWNQEELAEKMGKSIRMISNYEAGNIAKTEEAKKMKDLFGCSIDYILGLDKYRSIGNKEVSEITGLSDESIEALRKLNTHTSNDSAFFIVLNSLISSVNEFICEALEEGVPEGRAYAEASERSLISSIGMLCRICAQRDDGTKTTINFTGTKDSVLIDLIEFAKMATLNEIASKASRLNLYKETK